MDFLNQNLYIKGIGTPLNTKVEFLLKSTNPKKEVNGSFLKLHWEEVLLFNIKFSGVAEFERGEIKVKDRFLRKIILNKNSFSSQELTNLLEVLKTEEGEPTSELSIELSKLITYDNSDYFISVYYINGKIRIILELK